MKAVILLFCIYLFINVKGHGTLIEPPARNYMWKEGFPNPENYNHNELNCGGLQNQIKNGGKCGVCGDPYQGPLKHETGYPGGYANGIIVRSYKSGSVIKTTARITAAHEGYITYSICPINSKTRRVTQKCLDRFPLKDVNGRTKIYINEYLGMHQWGDIPLVIQLPKGLACNRCVIQWRYVAGNNKQSANDPQETFQNCADVSIQ